MFQDPPFKGAGQSNLSPLAEKLQLETSRSEDPASIADVCGGQLLFTGSILADCLISYIDGQRLEDKK